MGRQLTLAAALTLVVTVGNALQVDVERSQDASVTGGSALAGYRDRVQREIPWGLVAGSWRVDVPEEEEKEGFTMVINTFDSDRRLMMLAKHYENCTDVIKQIRFVWNEPWREPSEAVLKLTRKYPEYFVVDRNPGSNLTNRFLPRDFPSEAVFSQDDDLRFSCPVLRAGFELWKKHPKQIVGFGPRLINAEDPKMEYANGFLEKTAEDDGVHCCWHSAWSHGRANIVLVTKGGFLHKKMYEVFHKPKYAALRKIVDDAVSGEDLLMGMLHANLTRSKPIPLVLNWGNFSGLHKLGQRNLTDVGGLTRDQRATVTRKLNEALGFPLQETREFYDPIAFPDMPVNGSGPKGQKYLKGARWF